MAMSFICIIFILIFYKTTLGYVTWGPYRADNTTGPYAVQFTRLQKNLLGNYKTYGRPVKNISTTMTVKLHTVVTQLLTVDEEAQTITLIGFMNMEWNDEFLKWNIREYEDVNQMMVTKPFIWTPDLMLYNSAIGKDMGPFMTILDKVTVESTGRVTCNPKFKIKATCFFDFSDYPYDTQICPLIFGSWSYTLKMLDLIPLPKNRKRSFPTYEMTNNNTSGWSLVDHFTNISYWNAYAKVRSDVKPPPQTQHLTFAEYTVWLKFRRLTPYYGALVLTPACVTSAFTLVFYWLPSDGLALALSLANTALQMMFTDNLLRRLPPSNEDSAPRIVKYYAINLTCTVFSAIIFAILSEITKRKRKTKITKKNIVVPPPKILNQFGYARQNLVSKLDARLGFQRQVDEEISQGERIGEEVQKNRDLSDIPMSSNQMIEDKSEWIQNQNHWMNIVGGMRLCAFFAFLVVYVVSALFLLI
uniref:Neurotransmitter-gated ion-channel ligand-binding domain-containing protein n=1 Tax=Romanomermis culicivorax TaxID=13658 RepID=A0A915JMK2_ROMCU